jgi:transposase
MKAYSVDLREKIVEAYLQQEGSIRNLAKRFKVSARFVWGLVNRFRRTGSYAPKAHRGGNPPRIAASQYDIIIALVTQAPDATLEELCARVEETCSLRPSKSSLHRTLDKLKLTRKKRPIAPQSVTPPRSKPNGKRITNT